MDNYRKGHFLREEEHEIINDYIQLVGAPQKHSITIIDEDYRDYIPCPNDYTLIGSQDRIFSRKSLKSTAKVISDIESILKELKGKKQDGDYCIYNNFGKTNQTFFFLSIRGGKSELAYNDPNLSTYFVYDLDEINWEQKKIIQRLKDSHGEKTTDFSFYVTQLSSPNNTQLNAFNRSKFAWQAELIFDPNQLSVKDKRGYTPLLCALNSGKANIC